MSVKYSFFTEIKVNGIWECINNSVVRTRPYFERLIAPTYKNSSRSYFEKTYLKISEDGNRINMDEISDKLRCKIKEYDMHIGEPKIALYYESILSYFSGTGKEHYGFASRKDVADFESGREDEIYEYVSIAVYKAMDDELKKAYQYYECNDRTGVYHYYSILRQEVEKQLRLWKCHNDESIEDIRLIMFIN